MKNRLKLSITTKLLFSFLLLIVLLLVVLGFFTLSKMNQMGRDAERSSISLGAAAIADGTRILEVVGETRIKQKALDVAKQASLYFERQTINNPERLIAYPALVNIALQNVGETGYTCLYEKYTGIMRIHPNPQLVNYDMHNLERNNVSWWRVFGPSMDGADSSGYYQWQDDNGNLGEKFMYMTSVEGTPYMIAACIYVDEMSKPIMLIQNRITVETAETTDHLQNMIDNTRKIFIIFFIIILFVVSAGVIWLSRTITRPIKALVKGSEAIGQGNLEYKVNINSGDELEELANSFNRMSTDLQKYTTELRRTTAEKERVEKELEIARGIQQSFLPESPPEVDGVDMAALNLPAREVGGDFYDFIPIGAYKWGLVIADVSGKGVPAALFMALSRTLVRANVNENVTVSEAIRKSNDVISENDRSNMFVTLFYGVLDPRLMMLTYVSAGHNPPIMLGQGGNEIVLLKARGVALGVIPDITLEEKEIKLDHGDVVVLYTDGVTEAINSSEEQFGQDRVIAVTEKYRHLSASEIMEHIKQEVLDFSEGQPQFDDITLLILKIK
ncbi:MAG: SpoIIE family protein phosphatase [Dehalococcoidales bacterium]|nr:SpoIIE family protein phosphatase [Dehalococcoidales bacterium]